METRTKRKRKKNIKKREGGEYHICEYTNLRKNTHIIQKSTGSCLDILSNIFRRAQASLNI